MNGQWTRRPEAGGTLAFESDAACVRIPAVLGGRYAIEDVFAGSGGFGTIFSAVDRRVKDWPVLVKARRYPPKLFRFREDDSRPDQIERIRRLVRHESDCLVHFGRLGEGRLPTLLDLCVDRAPGLAGPHRDDHGQSWCWKAPEFTETEPYLVLRKLPGQTLGEHLSPELPMTAREPRALAAALELGSILELFHTPNADRFGRYFIYQDLKPDNVIVSHGHFLTLLDLGAMTVVIRDEKGQTRSDLEGFGSPGTGTWGYKAPELNPVARLQSLLDGRVDVYGLGATLYHILSGQDLSRMPVEYPLLDAGPLADLGCHRRTVETLRKALRHDRQERHQTIRELRTDLLAALRDLSPDSALS
jgi:serine/threonine protein kinase